MPAGPCTGALRRKLPTGHPSEAGPPGHRSISGARCTWSTRVLPAACPTPRGHPAKSSGRVQGSTPEPWRQPMCRHPVIGARPRCSRRRRRPRDSPPSRLATEGLPAPAAGCRCLRSAGDPTALATNRAKRLTSPHPPRDTRSGAYSSLKAPGGFISSRRRGAVSCRVQASASSRGAGHRSRPCPWSLVGPCSRGLCTGRSCSSSCARCSCRSLKRRSASSFWMSS